MFDLAITKMRQHAFLDDRAVEVRACDVHAAAGIDLATLRVAESHHGDVERAAAEVEDDHVLRLRHGLLVKQRRGDGLEFKVHFLKPASCAAWRRVSCAL
jgi:hypothetical protein